MAFFAAETVMDYFVIAAKSLKKKACSYVQPWKPVIQRAQDVLYQ